MIDLDVYICEICKEECEEDYFHFCPPINAKYLVINTEIGYLRIDSDTGEIVKGSKDLINI